jgi:hypothetical protein
MMGPKRREIATAVCRAACRRHADDGRVPVHHPRRSKSPSERFLVDGIGLSSSLALMDAGVPIGHRSPASRWAW